MAATKPLKRENFTRNILLLVGAYMLIAGAVVGFLVLNGRMTEQTDPFNPELVALGKQIYAGHCAECHGVDLKGQPNWETQNPDGTYPAPPQDGTGHNWEHSDRQLFDFISEGGGVFAPTSMKSNMPAYKHQLEPKEIWAVLAYIKSTWPEVILRKHAATNFVGGFQHH